jgi:hypothetical protein
MVLGIKPRALHSTQIIYHQATLPGPSGLFILFLAVWGFELRPQAF